MFLRALFAFLALPGMIAGVIPVWIGLAARNAQAGSPAGFGLVGFGLWLLLWCVRDFYVAGKGTLAPWHPPRHLVVVGLYRRVRNPMYIAALTIALGWSIVFGSAWLVVYVLGLAVAFHLRVVLHEEPFLRRQFPEAWRAYSAAVPRWLPQLRREKGDQRD